jgi:LDH2 family malate/lactate/ureidoglycolate dehydrogenase
MAQIVSESVFVPSGPLRVFVRQCLENAELSSGHAVLVADSLVESNLRGSMSLATGLWITLIRA